MGRNRIHRRLLALAAFLALLGPFGLSRFAWSEPPKLKDAKDRLANRLARETSPYLLMHAHNPVDWYPWGADAFAKAKKEDKLVFLSIGYSSCFWCHVMERESFENAEVAKLLNKWFVCIKVDREERPDIDTIYMTSLNVFGQRGGWPLSMFLTAEGKPIVGGTYWPPEDKVVDGDRYPGFKTVLKRMHDLYEQKPKELAKQADKIAALTEQALAGAARAVGGEYPLPSTDQKGGGLPADLAKALVTKAVESIKGEFDQTHGGFGSPEKKFVGTKFPVPPYLELLLHEATVNHSNGTKEMITLTLDHMARGGIYDQMGGGFHRYSTERTWTVPHFEKMLYDNAQLVEVYSKAYQLTNNSLYRRIVKETLAFVGREMTAPEGGFYSALDAETNGEEGRFYVWTDQEIKEALAKHPDGGFFRKVYGADGDYNFESKYHILTLPKSLQDRAKDWKMTEEHLDARLASSRQKLFEARAKRPRPFLDTKVLTAWNGQMIAGYAVAGRILKEPEYIAAAVRAADFVLKNLRNPEGRLLRSFSSQPGGKGEARLNGYLDDYAFFTHGLLCLHDATGDKKWLEEARKVTDIMVQFHADKDRGGFFYTSNDHEKLFARAKDQSDGAQPSGNSVAVRNLVRMWLKTGDQQDRELAEKSLKTFAPTLKANPSSMTAIAEALALFLDAKETKAQTGLQPKEPSAKNGKKSDSVVKIEAAAEKADADGNQVVTVTITIDKSWHLYANPVPADFPGIPTSIAVEAKVKPEIVKVDYPEGKVVKDPLLGDYRVYEDKVRIKATVKRGKGDSRPLELMISVQACSEKQCLLPATVKVKVP
jgi:uncharacterized protein YyaL (SSP411 family)